MSEVLELSVKSNIKSVTKDTEDYGKSVESVEAKLERVNGTLKEQGDILKFLEQEEVRLQQKRQGMSEYEQSMSGINKTLEHTKLSIKDQKLALKDLTEEQREAQNAVNEMNAAQKEQDKLIKDGIGSFKVMGVSLNGIKASFGKIIPTAKLMFTTIKAGLISTGIGALVVAFGTLMAWFKKTKVGAEVLEKIFAGVGAAVSVIVDRIAKFGGAIAKLLSGDVKGAFSDMKGAFTGIGDEMLREISLAVALKQSLQDLVNSERALSVEMAQRRAEIEELMLKANDLNLTEEERLQALEDAAKIETDLMAQRVANAEEAVRIQKSQMSMSDNLKEDLDELAQKEITLANIRRDSAKKQRTIIRKTNQIRKQAAANETKRQNEWLRKQNEITTANNKLRQNAYLIIEELRQRNLKTDERRELRRVEVAMLAEKKIIEDSDLSAKEKASALKWLKEKNLSDIKIIEDKWDKTRREDKVKQQNDLTMLLRENDILALEDGIKAEQKAAKMELTNQEYSELQSVASLENAEELQAQIKIKYAELNSKMTKEHEEQDREEAKKTAAVKVELLAKGLDVIKSFMDVQAQELENNYKNEIALAEKNGKSTEGIEEKFAAKRREQAKKMKAMKIAMAIVDTYQSAVAAYAAGLSVGGPAGLVLGPASAALAIAAGLANVAMIEKQPLGDGGGGAGGAGGVAPQTPAPQMMSGAFTLGGGEAPDPVQAYVVTDDMTNNQNKLANIRRRATI
jgi:hypothetical protein